MSDTKYRLSTAVVDINILQGTTYWENWILRFKDTGDSFPFFNENGDLEWKGRCMFRASYGDEVPLLSLDSDDLGGVVITLEVAIASYGLLLSAVQTSALPSGRLVYDIEFERLSDGWVIRPQKGTAIIDPEATK